VKVGNESSGVNGMLVAVSSTGCWLTALKRDVCEAESVDAGGMGREWKGGFSGPVCRMSVHLPFAVHRLRNVGAYHSRGLLSHGSDVVLRSQLR
jgi:hypothetical protein